jgi:hypothetical protein
MNPQLQFKVREDPYKKQREIYTGTSADKLTQNMRTRLFPITESIRH